jgi:very-short-patch-repair endonuclease
MEERRRKLRNNMTHAEVILWNCIRRNQIHGVRFRRQFSIKEFIVDFYSPELMLVIEVDGPTHCSDEEVEYDKCRQSELEKSSLRILRFTNDDVYNNITGVVGEISKVVDIMLSFKRPPLGLPLSGGDEKQNKKAIN